MRILDLFSGIGGFSLAAEWCWGKELEIVGFVEINQYRQRVLKKHWPDVPIYDDIRKVNGDEFGTVDFITGGDPCQPSSYAGKRKGKEDDRYLWPEFINVCRCKKPDWIINENVIGISSVDLSDRITDLERLQYQVQTFDISASAIGLPTMERHYWIVAASSCQRFKGSKKTKNQDDRNEGELQRTNKGIIIGRHISETKFCRVGERVSKKLDRNQRERLKSLGNAIVPQVAYIIMQQIKKIMDAD